MGELRTNYNSSPRADSLAQQKHLALVASIFVVALAIRCWWAFYTRFVSDDAFITFRYARQLIEGNGFTYNAGAPVYGTTTPLFTLLMASWYAIAPGNMTLGAFLFDLAAALASLALLAVMLQRTQITLPMQLMALGFLAVCVKVYRMDMSGAEMPWVVMWMMASWVALDAKRPALAGFFVGCLLWTRFDTVFWLLALCLVCTPKKVLVLFSVAGLTYLPWVVFATLYFGSPIPFTIIAKRIAYPTDFTQIPAHLALLLEYLSPLRFDFTPVALGLGCITLGIAFWQAARLRKQKIWLALPVFIVLEMMRLAVTGATMFSRYFVPFSWMAWILFAMALPNLWQASAHSKKLPAWVPWLCVVVCVIVLLAQGSERAVALREEQIFRHEASLKQMGFWLKANAAPNATVLLEPLGYVGYYSGLRMFDEVGLVTPSVVDLKKQGLPGTDYFAYLKPDYVILHCDDAVQLQTSSPVNGMTLTQTYIKRYLSNPLGFEPGDFVRSEGLSVSEPLPSNVLARNSCYEIWQRASIP